MKNAENFCWWKSNLYLKWILLYLVDFTRNKCWTIQNHLVLFVRYIHTNFELVGVCIKLALISSSYSIRNHMTTLLLISSMTHSVWNIFVQPPMHISNFDIPITSLYLNSRNIEVKHLCFFKRRGHATLEHIGATRRNRCILAHK